MSYEPTQPMTPPSTSLMEQDSEEAGRETPDGPAEGDAGQDDAVLDDAVLDDAVLDDAVQGDATLEAGPSDAVQDDAVLEDAVLEDADQDDATLETGPSDAVQDEAHPGAADHGDVALDQAALDEAAVDHADLDEADDADEDEDDAAAEATRESDKGQDDAPEGDISEGDISEGDISQATVPRAALGEASVPAPPGSAPQSGSEQDSGPQGDWAVTDEPEGDLAPADAVADDPAHDIRPQGGWGQGNGLQSDWDQGNTQQGYGPQGDWDQGNARPDYGPQPYEPPDYGPQGYGPQDHEPQDRPLLKPRRRRRPVRRSVIAFFILLVIAIVLVIGNFLGQAIAENDMANQFTTNGFPVKPSVDIEGFPFLTQVAHKDFKKVVISASNIPAGPVTISYLHATITGMHLNSSWNGATIDHVTATAFVSLNSLTGGISSELGDAASLTAVPDGADKLKVTGRVLGLSASGVVEIKQTGPQKITVELPTTGGLVGTLLGSAASFTITLPAGVPPSLRITGLTLNGQGLTLSAAASDATFSK